MLFGVNGLFFFFFLLIILLESYLAKPKLLSSSFLLLPSLLPFCFWLGPRYLCDAVQPRMRQAVTVLTTSPRREAYKVGLSASRA